VTRIPTRVGQALPRPARMRLVDQLMSRVLGLPAATTNYAVRRDVPIPMRDGVVLRADHYVPDTPTLEGTLLVRCPYGRAAPMAWCIHAYTPSAATTSCSKAPEELSAPTEFAKG
jgi:predicted acyl esterase